ncbi:hypothetical protein VTJ49DRAFT_3550 [Mycothermus thermophilus]|uniref:Ras guanine nucleotide exchange factor A n=1 Tax=Humicola insolens TaxID=85995 RepID=A0ABR3V7C4_HUMIN
MWVHTHNRPVSERSGGALPQLLPVPSLATPPRAAGASASSGSGTSFLLVDDPPAPAPAPAPASDPDPAHAPGIRDSFASIVNDPFFLRFHDAEHAPPVSQALSAPAPGPPSDLPALPSLPTASAAHRNDERNPPWIPPRKESLSDTKTTPWFEHANHAMESINIAVIGAEGVGKSTFIQHLRRAPRPSTVNITSLRHELDGTPYLVTLVELDLEGIELDPRQPLHWPKQIGGHMVPHMDGAMILYDAMNEDTTETVHPLMSALANSFLPTVLVATKCDTPDDLQHPDLASLASSYDSCVGHFRTASSAPSTARECLQAMLRAALASRKEKAEGSGARRRAASAANLDAPPDTHNGRPISQQSKHSRASSDFSLLRGFTNPPNEGQYRGHPPRSPRLDYQNSSGTISESSRQQTGSSTLRAPGIRLDGRSESFLDVDESDAESQQQHSDDVPILQRGDDALHDRGPKEMGVTFGELVDRLLAPKMSRADQNFADIFLCLYRKFAAPSELLAAIRIRLDRVRADRTMQPLVKTEAQMRIIEVVAKWLSTYPGDFARSATRRSLEELIALLLTEPVFVAAARQMQMHLEHKVAEDDDTVWAKSDPVDETPGTDDSPDQGLAGAIASMSSLHLEDSRASGPRRPSQSSDLSGLEAQHGDKVTQRFHFYSVEDYQREAATLVPSPTFPLNKPWYHRFMGMEVNEIAEEMTRIDWIMFSSFRIRDLVRDVSLSQDQKEKCRSLKNVTRMISHFNHVAQWVANMVLIRDKAKHRAPCLEKLMTVAHRLRQMNNYNGLAAVLAGLNGTSILRLAQTRELISADTGKRHAGLSLLMGTSKSHFSYRLAWENSPLPRIPFMPLHRRDLVSAEEGNPTFVGPNEDRINWKKFEVLGEVLLPIMKSQGRPYPSLHRHDNVRELILDCRMPTDEEEIYQRSVQVEPTGAPAESSKKRFPWLPKYNVQ